MVMTTNVIVLGRCTSRSGLYNIPSASASTGHLGLACFSMLRVISLWHPILCQCIRGHCNTWQIVWILLQHALHRHISGGLEEMPTVERLLHLRCATLM